VPDLESNKLGEEFDLLVGADEELRCFGLMTAIEAIAEATKEAEESAYYAGIEQLHVERDE